jgi:hypothetical protein
MSSDGSGDGARTLSATLSALYTIRSMGWVASAEQSSRLNKDLSPWQTWSGKPGLSSAEPLLAIAHPF